MSSNYPRGCNQFDLSQVCIHQVFFFFVRSPPPVYFIRDPYCVLFQFFCLPLRVGVGFPFPPSFSSPTIHFSGLYPGDSPFSLYVPFFQHFTFCFVLLAPSRPFSPSSDVTPQPLVFNGAFSPYHLFPSILFLQFFFFIRLCPPTPGLHSFNPNIPIGRFFSIQFVPFHWNDFYGTFSKPVGKTSSPSPDNGAMSFPFPQTKLCFFFPFFVVIDSSTLPARLNFRSPFSFTQYGFFHPPCLCFWNLPLGALKEHSWIQDLASWGPPVFWTVVQPLDYFVYWVLFPPPKLFNFYIFSLWSFSSFTSSP